MAKNYSDEKFFESGRKLDHDAQDRKFVAILYPDAQDYNCDEVLTNIIRYSDEWSYILHDKDVESSTNEQGEEVQVKKKEHYHVCFRFPTPRIRKTVSNNIGLEKNYIMRCKNWRAANCYLIHDFDDDKFQYQPLEVESNFEYGKLIGKKETELSKVNELIEFIIKTNCYRMKDLADYARNNDLWDALRRNHPILREYMIDLKLENQTKQETEEKVKKRKDMKK